MIERGEYPLYGPLNSGAPAAVNFVAGESALRIIELQSMSAITSMKHANDIKTDGILTLISLQCYIRVKVVYKRLDNVWITPESVRVGLGKLDIRNSERAKTARASYGRWI